MIIKLLKIIIRKLSAIITLLKLLSFVALAFCVWMCVHYYIQHYPDAEVTSMPFDYNGMLVGFFTLLVTLLQLDIRPSVNQSCQQRRGLL